MDGSGTGTEVNAEDAAKALSGVIKR
jgi:hypothetical protein